MIDAAYNWSNQTNKKELKKKINKKIKIKKKLERKAPIFRELKEKKMKCFGLQFNHTHTSNKHTILVSYHLISDKYTLNR